MKINLPILILSFIAISSLNQPCEAVIGELIGTASSITGLVQFIEELVGKLSDKSSSKTETIYILENMNTAVQNQLAKISEILKQLPSLNDHVHKENKLQILMGNMAREFINAAEMKKDIENDSREPQNIYEKFEGRRFDLDLNILEIKDMLLDNRTTTYLTKNFTEGLRLYDNVCITQMSHQQLLKNLLTQFKVSLGHYFAIRNMMIDFVAPYRNSSEIFNNSNSRKNLRKKVLDLHRMVVKEFKKLMASASQELWRCDPSKTDLDEKQPDNIYYELNAFSKYIVNEGILADWTGTCGVKKCVNITKIDNCGQNDARHMCYKTRKCPNTLVGCDNLHDEKPNHESTICINSDNTATKRYTYFVYPEVNPKKKFYCPADEAEEINLIDITFNAQYANYQNATCKFCQCICPEKTYYISTRRMLTDIRNNMVVTGARLVVEDDTIYVQIQQAKLLPGGIINSTSVEWLDIIKDNNRRVPISWEDVRSVDLMSFKYPKNSAVVGFGFQLSGNVADRVTLKPHACKLNFRAGRLTQCFDILHKDSPMDELKLTDADVPTKALMDNRPISNDNQFVTFTITSLEKDGGQTTIPFIDTQEVVPSTPTLLSGGGLYLRGQKGYGGFLALKLYTYNLGEHISEYVDLPEDIPW